MAKAMTRRRSSAVGFRLNPVKIKAIKGEKLKKPDVQFEHSCKPLKKGGKSFIATASRELKNSKFETMSAYRTALKNKIAEVRAAGRSDNFSAVSTANQQKTLSDMQRSVGSTPQLPEQTPWSMGGGGWPLRPELVEKTRVRLWDAAKAAKTQWKEMITPLKESLSKLVDEKAVSECPTMLGLLEFYKVNAKVVDAQPCSVNHFGLCEQRDAACLQKSFALAKLLCQFTLRKIPKPLEGKVCFMFRSDSYACFAFQGKVKRRPQWQGYVFHAIENKDLVHLSTDPYRCPSMPAHRVQDCQMPLVLKLHEYSEEPLSGYIGCCTAFGLARTLFTLEVATVEAKCISAERCEVAGDVIQRVAVVRTGIVMNEFEALRRP